MTDTYTLREVARMIARKGDEDDVRRVMRQIRHWTVCEALVPEGDVHTGTGVSRRYGADEVRIAALLLVLSKYGMTMTEFEYLREMLENVVESWRPGEEDLFWEVTWNEEAFRGKVSIGAPEMLTYQAKYRPGKRRKKKPADMPDWLWEHDPDNIAHAIAINATRIFERIPFPE
jgi:hypothetical protein